jgi:hypothetical protein
MLLATQPRRPRIASDVMEEHGPTDLPQYAGASRRLLRRLQQYDDQPRMTASEARIASSVERTIDERLADGLMAIEEQATVLMREIAGEVWRASGADARPEQDRIVSLLSRDQAIRSLLATTDERFQALAMRSERLEDSVSEVTENGRAARASMEATVAAIRAIADSPTIHGVEAVRSQLEQVEHHIAAAFAHFDERDRALTEDVLGQVKSHGELVAGETARLVDSMQEYVQTGAEAMALLAQRIEAQAEAFTVQDVTISEHVGDMVATEIRPVAQQLEMLAEKVGLHGRDQDQVRAALERLLDARVMGLAQLIRSDSEALRTVMTERAEDQVEALRETVEWRMAAFAERLDEKMDAAAEQVASRASEAAEMAIASSLGQTMERMNAGVGAIDGLDTMMAEGQAAVEERMRAHIDDRLTAVARLIRSDNQALAQAMAERDRTPQTEPVDPELLRQTVRAIKELQAGLADDVQDSVDRRFQTMSDQLHEETQSTAESMIKIAEILGEKIDRLSVRVDEGYGNELQVVVDRMSDAIQAMSSVRRTA